MNDSNPTCYEAIQTMMAAMTTLNGGRDAIVEWVENDTECVDILKEGGWRIHE